MQLRSFHTKDASKLFAVILRPPCRHVQQRPRLKPCFTTPTRSFSLSTRLRATHRDSPSSSLLTQALDQKQQTARNAQSDSAGPFMLGTVPRSGPTPKKWSELSTKGKVLRSTARTSNFTVIAIGASFTALLAYALLSELFARNSPTVLYNDACTRITQSPRVREHMPGALAFHNNPPTTKRPKHRNRHVSSQVFADAAGKEHLVLNFYVSAKKPVGERAFGEDGALWGVVRRVTENAWTWEELSGWAGRTTQALEERTRSLFLFLSGENGSGTAGSKYPYETGSTKYSSALDRRETQIGKSEEGRGMWASVTGLFSGLGKSVAAAATASSSGTSRGETFDEAEVHCELIKNDDGNFVWRYILVDMPNTRVRYPNRVFVERAPGVPDNVAVIRWY